ncbi:MAG: hypothetical protein Kow0074_08380 [Candidatus Zixiibacteriota bacterium]
MTTGRSTPAPGLALDSLQDSGNCLYVVDSDLVITYVNPVYLRFAEENGGTEIAERFSVGCQILDAINGPLRDFYKDLYERALRDMEVIEHEYECSAADTFRWFRMHIFPLGDAHGLLVDHSLIVSRDHDREPYRFVPESYINGDGFLIQCGHCRRIKHQKANRWDWCPDALGRLKISHGLCDSCLEHYYPDPDKQAAPG